MQSSPSGAAGSCIPNTEMLMDLEKIKTLIDFVGRSNVTELTVTQKDTTVQIFRLNDQAAAPAPVLSDPSKDAVTGPVTADTAAVTVRAPIFGILHRAPSPGEPAFVQLGETVEEGQTLFIIEAMKVFNRITSPRAGRITRLSEIDGGEVETGDLLAEITA